jgi:release factor glutamine methyltransferase
MATSTASSNACSATSANGCSPAEERTPRNVAGAVRAATKALRRTSTSGAMDAAVLVAHVLGRSRSWLIAHGDAAMGAEQESSLAALVARRAGGEPLAYIVGEAWFYGRPFAVTPDVLVPRPETEHVVEAALADLRARRAAGRTALRACDVGTGSGAIAITLGAELPDLDVTASDASEAALEVAKGNARRLGVGSRVRFVAGDLDEPLLALGPFDCIVANLPYVPTADVPERPDPVGHEPRVAIDGGVDGLVLYRRLARALPSIASPDASAFFEAAPGTVERLAAIVADELPGAHVEVGEDYAGLERWVAVVRG